MPPWYWIIALTAVREASAALLLAIEAATCLSGASMSRAWAA